MSINIVSFSRSSTSNISLTMTCSRRARTSTVGPWYCSCTATCDSASAACSAWPKSSAAATKVCLGPARRSLMWRITSWASASPAESPSFWRSSKAWPAASCPFSRLLLRKCAQAANTSIRPSSFSMPTSWQMATASFTTFMPSSSLNETMCTWAVMYMESITRLLSPIFFAIVTASLAASNARSLSFDPFFGARDGSSPCNTSSTSADRIRSCTTPTLSPMSCMRFLAMRAESSEPSQSLLSAWTLASMCKDLASPLAEPPSLKMARASSADSRASPYCSERL
mmetsp:Transcript_83615/g.249464  ORF Transcript_83615/g.249464 Transcript_83615/m.249464 type:complete len:284 (+) Transcript_83615:280-1131(+)